MSLRRYAWPAAALGLVLVAVPVAAQTPVDESLSKRDARRLDNMEKVVNEMRAIVFKGRDTGKPVEVEPADTGARLDDLTNRINDLEQSLTKVNGSLETTAHELELTRRANQNLAAEVKDLEDKLADLQKQQAQGAQGPQGPQAGAPTASAEDGGAPAAPAGDPNEAFTKARRLMLSGEYDAAETAFRNYVQTYPDAPKTPEARYWWGKTLSVKGAHAEAATAYIGAIRGWPQTSWAPDAVVELARELAALKKTSDACQAVAELPKHYAKAPASVKARASRVKTEAKCG